jgi:uncharacterized protein YfbU (UPF0304 family)
MPTTLTLRVDDDTKIALEAVADARGTTLSEVLRNAIDTTLDRSVNDQPGRQALTTLSVRDRHDLAMKHDMLALLSEDEYDKKHHQTRARVFREGLTYEYGNDFDHIYPELSHGDCRLVRDVLSMFDSIKASLGRLASDDPADPLTDSELSRLHFGGFDGNDSREGHMATYVKHLLDEDRWQSVKEDWQAADRGNSHMPTLAAYLRQLEVYAPMWQSVLDRHSFSGPLLTTAELRQIAEAWNYPRS